MLKKNKKKNKQTKQKSIKKQKQKQKKNPTKTKKEKKEMEKNIWSRSYWWRDFDLIIFLEFFSKKEKGKRKLGHHRDFGLPGIHPVASIIDTLL